ncbi:MAG: hypothetical protein AUJ28_02320 [Parcubacteria group bacterium CG1_02_37_51]|uniref:Thymidine kinase n=2 Tax=Candidatus Komeiliibacteriota TaxID=1817908 RepID=A0A2M8DPZ5_9BACT|nr:MAG: hypothetical protein AUJ28_02320 [Parcubacteria group bacterium CG1_02_37_51]PIY94880.1 MAG: thymidine kinase [Candidatus Komeilibacteria bacterium CG_4_10_14_0_8_um_filter_37_78]PJC00975.1 MAG: thymidine kinase [Candidatus Komeilibacteria bacterium CG_4_9_14_0_8_um_filter_36_9]
MENINQGFIVVICGCMFSGKTEELMRRKRRADIANRKTILFKPKKDNRYSETDVVTHNKQSEPAIIVESAKDLERVVINGDYDYVFIDEGQFFDPALARVCQDLADQGKCVHIAGLDMDSDGHPFEVMRDLAGIAEFVDKIHAICTKCGKLASFTIAVTQKSERLETGGKDKYDARCRSCLNS